jgi:hypothetical protein
MFKSSRVQRFNELKVFRVKDSKFKIKGSERKTAI